MLSIANAQGRRGLTCFSHARLPAKRLASLTGAIQRGARKSWDVRDRTERYNSRTNSNVETGFTGDYAKAPRRAAPFQQDYARNREFEPGLPKWDSRADMKGMTRSSRRDPRQAAHDGRRAERFARRVGDSRPFSPKPRAQAGSLRGGKRYGDTPRDRPEAATEVPENLEPRHYGLSENGDSLSSSGRPGKEETDTRRHHSDRHRPSGLSEGADKAVRERQPAIGLPHWQGGHESFSRNQTAQERPRRTEARDREQRPRFKDFSEGAVGTPRRTEARGQDQRPRFKDFLDETAEIPRRTEARDQDQRPRFKDFSERSAAPRDGGRRPYIAKFSAGQTSAGEQEALVMGRPGQETVAGKRRVTVPLSIPRSSAASEFIYGTSAVKAALRARTRKLYKLYIYQGEGGVEERGSDKEILKFAERCGLDVKRLGEGADDLRLLSKMSQGRPHNGYVLEASQLPITPVEGLDSADRPGDGFTFTPGHQSAEEVAVNGNSNKIEGKSNRYPLVLMLDSILDPGNLGAIIRSAAFFGVDAIALVDNNLAPFSPVTLKASSGAAEHMPYLKIKKDIDFVRRSQSNGWKFFAAVAPESASASRRGPNAITLRDAEDALRKGPCVLMLGGEGDGLRPRLQKAADEMIGIEGAVGLNSEVGLDSLNVSVAAALMMQIFVKGSNAKAGFKASARETANTREDGLLF
jgi:21S rRNA (GM2251-2'-O)-methyltransferase